MSKSVFITGITGMVGSHLADFLLSETDYTVFGLLRWRSDLCNLANSLHFASDGSERLNLLYGDLREPSSLDDAMQKAKPDIVFHLAAQSFPKTSFSEPNITYETNVNGTQNILNAVLRVNGNAIVHVCSSSEVFGRVSSEEIPINENCRFHPASPYAISKVGTDLVGRFFAEAYGLDTRITRMFTHTGPRRGDVFAESSFAKQIAMIENGFIAPVVKVGNLDSLRTIADVRDAVRAYYLLVSLGNIAKGEVFNIGGSTSKTVREILEYLISISKMPKDISFEVEHARVRPIDADLQVPDTTKFRNATGWEPEYSFETTMRDLLQYWRDRMSVSGNSFLPR